MTANAQQINGDFDAEWTKCTPWTSKNNTKVVGTQPVGWHASNVYASGMETKIIESVDGVEGNAVKLTNKELVGQKIPGYLTLGTPWATAETKLSIIRNADGGAFGGLNFTFHPDALSFDYKRDNANGEENATVVAYLWNGTWTQKDVPGNTAVGAFGWGSATKVDMTDRDRNVLGKKTETGGDVTCTDGATLVASLEQAVEGSTGDEWKSMTIPFTYTQGNETATVENLNVLFSATDYFGDRNNIVGNNSLTIDNVKLVYYHALSSLSATDNEGNEVELDFSPEVYNYTVNSEYDEYFTEISYQKVGVGASVETEYNEKKAQYVIIVKGEDFDAQTNPDAMSVYTIQYNKPKPKLQSLVVGGHEYIKAGDASTEFTSTGVYPLGDVDCEPADEDATAESVYDEETNTLKVFVSQEGAPENVYTITFEGKKKDAVYQIPNADFEEWTEDGLPAAGWNSFDTAVGQLASFAFLSPLPQKVEGYEGNGVRIVSKDLALAYANGNLTTGHINMGSINPADASNFNFTDRTDVDGNIPFAGTPDAFEVYARFTPGKAKEEDVELNGRVQLILHGDAAYHDPELEDMASDKIASASVLIPATEEWTKFTGEFKYVGYTSGDMYMLASATTNPVPGASKDDQLDLDNLKLIYYSTLSDISLDGKTIEGFAEDKTDYVISGNIKELASKLECTAKSNFAAVSTDVDYETGDMTVTVFGNDYMVNPGSKTIYTIHFDTSTGLGSISADEAQNHKVFTLSGVRVMGKPAAGIYVIDGKKMIVK